MKPFYKEVKADIKNLKQQGKLKFPETNRKKKTLSNAGRSLLDPYVFRWPLANALYRDFPSWNIVNFVDHNATSILDDTDGDGLDDDPRNPLEIGDYNCGDRTYDGHSGIDIGVDPYSWEEKNSGFVQVVAAYGGVIVEKHQGEYDENCGSLGSSPTCSNSPANRGNYIVMLLDDSSTAIFYMHMKDGSLTAKNVGDYIDKGEYIGTVGSAGCSTGPHLHFEVHLFYDDESSDGSRIETFLNGSCAWDYSWAAVWENEPPYNDPAVLTLETHSSNPDNGYTGSCDKTLQLFYKDNFASGNTVWLRSMFRDWVDGLPIQHNVYNPSGGLSISYLESNPTSDRTFIPTDHSFTASAAGTWRFTATIAGKIYDHYFAVNCLPTYSLFGSVSGHKGYMCSDHITSIQTISSSSANYIKYMADGYVVLSPGFVAASGCRFVANLEGCSHSIIQSAKSVNTVPDIEQQVEKIEPEKAQQVNILKVYPNPSKGIFTMQYSNKGSFNAMIMIRDINGKVVYASKNKNYINQLTETINIGRTIPGIYLAEIHTGVQVVTTKIFIQ